MRTLGILGGMGPGATVDFMAKIVRLAGDSWPRIVLDMDPSIPSRTLAAMGKGPDPGAAILRAIAGLVERGAAVVAVPCNSAHAWHPGADSGFTWLHMPCSVSAALHSRDIWHPLIVGGYATISKRLYDPFFAFGCGYLDDAGNEAVYTLIADIKKSVNPGRKFNEELAEIIARYRKVDYDAILLACTELSIIWPTDEAGDSLPLVWRPVIDSSWEYAKAVMRKLKEG